jgi:hypothetical protein
MENVNARPECWLATDRTTSIFPPVGDVDAGVACVFTSQSEVTDAGRAGLYLCCPVAQ